MGSGSGHLSSGGAHTDKEIPVEISCDIAADRADFPLSKHISSADGLGGREEMREMRVGYRLKTKDVLLDIWTSALVDISLCLRGALVMGLRL